MLDVIGAGATATTDRDWHQVWLDSDGCHRLQADIEDIHNEGRKRPPISATLSTRFASPWVYQLRELLTVVAEHRTSTDPFDVAVMGDPTDDTAPWREAGATWWLTRFPHTVGADEVRSVIDAGPPPV